MNLPCVLEETQYEKELFLVTCDVDIDCSNGVWAKGKFTDPKQAEICGGKESAVEYF